MNKLEHIGIAVSNLDKSTELFSKILGKNSYKSEVIKSEGVRTTFFKIGDVKLELVGAINQHNAISKYLESHSEGIHHIALLVEDIYTEIDRINKIGIRVLNEDPKTGADNKLISFLHPKDTNGVLIELCQETT